MKFTFAARPPSDLCPNVEGKQRAIVAVSTIGNAAVVVSASCGIVFDMREAGVDAGDVWTPRELEDAFLAPPHVEGGLRVWEGVIAVVSSGGWEHPEEHDVEYRGGWRGLNEREALAVAAGADPFRCRLCDGSGVPRWPLEFVTPR